MTRIRMSDLKPRMPVAACRAMIAMAGLWSMLLVPGPVRAEQLDVVWTGGTGNWSIATNWDLNVVPNNGVNTYNVLIDDGDTGTASDVSVNTSPTIDNLTINPDDLLRILNGRSLAIVSGESAGLIDNAGIIQLESTISLTELRLSGGLVTLTGGGVILLSNHANNRILGIGGGSLVIQNQIVRGAGQLGAGVTTLTNHATIIADQPVALTVQPNVNPMTNSGNLRAQSGGTLRLISGAIDNAGGLIEALPDSVVELSDAVLLGGTLSSFGSGFIRATGINTLNGEVVPVVITGRVDVVNGANLMLRGDIENQENINLLSTGSATDLRMVGDLVTLSGGGEVHLGNHANNRLTSTVGTALVNVDNTLHGSGQIGVNAMPLVNQGTIIADQEAPLVLDPPATPIVNSGTMRADNGATLRLINGTFDNSGGLIDASNESVVEIQSATIRGGTINVPDPNAAILSGLCAFDGQTEPLTLVGDVFLLNGSTLSLHGEIENVLHLNIESTGSFTDLRPTVDVVTLTGGGVIHLSNHTSNRIIGASGGSLVNMDNTIRGSGQIGANQTDVTNHGLIFADQSAMLTVDPAVNPFVNRGMMVAQLGATLRLQSGSFDNVDGVIQGQTGSFVELSGATIEGGTLSTIHTGLIRAVAQNTLDGTANTITVEGDLEVANGADLTARGTIHNTGTIRLASTGSLTDFEPTGGPVLLTGGGQLTMSNHANNRILAVAGGSLQNVDNTISGSGQLGFNLTPIVNQGTILANQSVALTINPDNTIGLNNQGVLRASDGATVNIADGPFTSSGQVIVDPASTLARTGGMVQTAGEMLVRGSLSATGLIDIQGGMLRGDGIVMANVESAGTVAPGASTGILSIVGNYTQSVAGVLAIDIGGDAPGSGYDRLAVSGTAALDGTISIAFVNDFVPTIGQTFTVMTYASQTGNFAAIDVPCPPGFSAVVIVQANSVIVEIVASSSMIGDLNCDCAVTVDDVEPFVLALLDPAAYAAAYPGCDIDLADTNGDTSVDALDIQSFVELLLP